MFLVTKIFFGVSLLCSIYIKNIYNISLKSQPALALSSKITVFLQAKSNK